MAAGSFQVGQRFLEGEATYRIMRSVGEGLWAIEDLSNGRIREETTVELLSKWERSMLRFPEATGSSIPSAARQSAFQDAAIDAFKQSYPEALWHRAKAKLAFVRRLKNVPITASTIVPLIQEIWSDTALWKGRCVFKSAPHFTTVAAWIRDYKSAGDDIRALADRNHCKGSTRSRYESVVEDCAEDVIQTLYLTLERPSIKSCLSMLRGRVAKLNLERLPSEQLQLPTYAYLKRKIGQIPRYDVCVARYGKRLADIKFRAARMGPVAEHPLMRASMDHCRLDLIVVDDATGLPLGRPWLTLIIDECTRYILGYYIGFEEPSNVSVARALRNAIMPKAELLARYPGVKNDWGAWGAMQVLVLDNGLEFHGDAIEHGAGRFGIVLQFCPRRKPWYKGKIERFFGTVNSGLLSQIPGRTFCNILEKADYDPVKQAIVGLETLREILLTWIVDVYHQKHHRTLGQSPAEAWSQGILSADQWLPTSSLSLESAFSRRETRRLTHKGIEFDSLFYNSNDMRVLREQHGAEIQVEVRVMDDDLGSIVVVSPNGQETIRVAALDGAYAVGLTRWQHRICRRFQRRLQDDEAREISLYEAKVRIREMILADMGRGRRGLRKKQQRFMGDGPPSVPASSQDSATLPTPLMDPAPSAPMPDFIDIPSAAATTTSVSPEAMDDVPVLRGRRI